MSRRTPAKAAKQKARSDANRLKRKAYPYVVKKRSPEKTTAKMIQKEIKRKRYLIRKEEKDRRERQNNNLSDR